ncbi:carbohydrate ABC transporter permease [Cohnella sp. GCM10027633]|uniref:carbohydrate ABC transporter permease n=1 Tax=unclassified Cohnella TaxID=2636738 RepID=UPI00362F232E
MTQPVGTTLSKPPRIARGRGLKERKIGTYATLFALSFLMILPLVWLLRSSLMDNAQIFIFPPEWIPEPFRWSNYPEALTAVPFSKFFLNTMTLELLTVSGVLVTTTITAYTFARLRWPGKNIVFGVLLATAMLPSASTLIPMFVFWREMGALDSFIPLFLPSWFGAGVYTGQGVFAIFLMRQFFMTIPRELDEAAYMDGANPLTVLWHIVLPLSKPAILVITIFSFNDVWNQFLEPTLYLSSEDKYTMSLGLASFKGLYNAQWGYLMAASATMIAPIILLFFLAQRYFIEGITLTGIKG